MSDNIVLAWPNHIDSATLSAAGATYTKPLINVKNQVYSKIAKTTTLSQTIKLDWAAFKTLGMLAIANHNFSVSALIRVVAYYDAAQTDVLYDSGDLPVWESVLDSEDLEWEDDNFWFGEPSEEHRALFTPLFYLVFPENYPVRSINIIISDLLNDDEFLSFGRIFVAPYFQPEFNMSYNHERGYKLDTDIIDCSGTEYAKVKSQRRSKTLALEWLSEADALNKMYLMQRTQGVDKEVFYADQIEKNQYSIQTSFIGRLADLTPLQQPYFDIHSAKINLIEIV